MKYLFINLINFNSVKIAGAGYFFKRIVNFVDFDSKSWDQVDCIVIFGNSKVDPVALFGFNESKKIKLYRIPFASSFFIRILIEQVLLPFMLIGKQGVFYSPTPAIPLLTRLFNRKLKLVPTIHDMIPFHVKNKYSRLRSIYVKGISILAAKFSSKIITVSEYSKNDISAIAEVPTSKIQIVYNFIPGIKLNRYVVYEPYFLTVCTVEPGKNIENMLKGFRLFLDQNIDLNHFQYYIIGQLGWDYQSILTLVEDLKLTENVQFLGYLHEDEKNKYIQQCTGMIYLSKFEGFGIPPLEGMYANKVSIVSNTSSLPEVVGDAGIVQDPDDYQLLAQNLKVLVYSSNMYTDKIDLQLSKFDPQSQFNNFKNSILELYD